MRMAFKTITFMCLLIIGQTGTAQTVNLRVTVNNLKEVSGVVFVSLFSDEKSFPIDGKEFRKLPVRVSALSASCIINDLPFGEYAVAVFHDQNADGICNLGLFGVPKEGFGFSNNFKPKWKAPDFKDCRIELLEDKALTIELIFR